MQEFIHLHVHTHYSILDGLSKINKLVDKAIADGMKGMAITDHGNMFGVKELFDYCNKKNKALKDEGKEPFKPIFGCEMYVARNGMEAKRSGTDDRGGWHLIVLAKNHTGYKNLIKLVSDSWVDGFYGRPRTDHEHLEKYHEGLIICSACIAGEVPSYILKGDMESARKALEWHKNIWGDDFYLELQRHQVTDPNQRANRETYPLQQRANDEIIKLAREYGVKLVCTNDVHFVEQEEAEAHDHLLCLSTGKDLDDPSRMLYSKQEWFKTTAEMNAIFSDVPEALANTVEILDKIESYNLESDPIMPFYPIPEDFGTEEEWRRKFTEEDLYKEFTSDENGENQLPKEKADAKIKKLGGYEKLYRIKFEADYLAKLAYDGAKRIYGEPLSDEVIERVNFELHIMKTMGFPGYFLIVQDFINSARQELGVWVGPGRGSAAGSVVAYCLGITKLDPLKYDLLFERFLNPDRISLPDIDTDFDDDGRGKVLQWVMDKYGHENCAHIITYGSMATKNSIKDVARVEKLPLDRSNELCKAIPDRLPDGLKMNLGNAIKCTPKLREAEASQDPREKNTIKYAKMLEGTVRGTGIHACGFIICRDPISAHVPVSTADDPDFPNVKTAVTQYDGHVIESTGLIKMDFLGLKTLSEQKEACRIIKAVHGVEIDLDNIPIDDELTYELYQKGQTIGTFQFESPGMQKYLRELHPTVFGDLIAMNALYRPGPMEYIPTFIKRKHGEEPIVYDIPIMEKYLKDTYGVTVYQEQVMLLSRLLANFTRGESDKLRKAMGKKQMAVLQELKGKFMDGGKSNGHEEKVLEKIWKDWEAFASYAFNKSHAACYSWVAYQTAYLKAHYPAEFMAAIMTRRKSDIKEITKLMDECKALGIPCLGPDVNESFVDFGVNKKGEIRFGLAAIKGMGEAAALAIIEEREVNGQYKDVFDLVERVSTSSCNRKAVESLALSGALDCFNIRREQYFEPDGKNLSFSQTLISYGQKYQLDKQEQQNSLFGGFDSIEIARPQPPKAPEWSDIERLNKERDLVGIYLSAHPLDKYGFILDKFCNVHPQDVGSQADKQALSEMESVVVGGIVTNVSTGYTKRGNPMGRITLEDFENSGEIALFDQDWARYSGMLQIGASVMITMSYFKKFQTSDYINCQILNVEFLSEVKKSRINGISISMTSDSLSENAADFSALFPEDAENADDEKIGLQIVVTDSESGKPLTLKSKRMVSINSNLLDFMRNHESWSYNLY